MYARRRLLPGEAALDSGELLPPGGASLRDPRAPWPAAAMETTTWPDDLRPDGAPVATHNALVVPSPPEQVWDRLVRAPKWPEIYANAADVHIDGDAPDLTPGAHFTWRTLGFRVATTVAEFDPRRLLTWRGDTWYGRGRHTWTLDPVPGGTRLVTEEVQRGLVPTLLGWWIRPRLYRWHQRWLEGLATGVQRSRQ